MDTRRAYHEELERLDADVLALAALVAEAIQAGTSALLDFDLAAAERLIVGDKEIDKLTHSIEDRCFHVLALQAPVASELRTLISILRITHELERGGDLMVNVAKATRRLYPEALDPKVRGLLDRMRAQAVNQVRVAADAYADRDPAKAVALHDMDDAMDDLQKDLLATIFASRADDGTTIQRAVQVALIGRYFERIADHAVNVAERVEFMVTGHLGEEPGRPRLASA